MPIISSPDFHNLFHHINHVECFCSEMCCAHFFLNSYCLHLLFRKKKKNHKTRRFGEGSRCADHKLLFATFFSDFIEVRILWESVVGVELTSARKMSSSLINATDCKKPKTPQHSFGCFVCFSFFFTFLYDFTDCFGIHWLIPKSTTDSLCPSCSID